MKICNKCNTIKPLYEFGRHVRQADGLRRICKRCENAAAKARTSIPAVKEKAKLTQAKYRSSEKGIETRKNYDDKYRQSDKRKTYKREYDKAYFAKRRRIDVLFNLACKVRKLINIGLKKQGFTKNSKSADLLGCDFSMLVTHLESQFKPEMTWDNFGEWHIDHVIPISSATTLDEFVHLTHYTNLQPMWGEYNIQKSNMMPDQWDLFCKLHRIDVSIKPNN